MTDQPSSTVAPTPGPWREGVSGNFRIYGPGNMGRQSGPIAEAWPINNADIQRANCRLIAAAPETAAERDRLQLEIEQCHAKSTCCCGDYMKQHSTYSGHSPISMYDNALSNIEAERDRLVGANEELMKALEDMITRFERCMIASGTDAEFATLATAQATAVLAEARKR